MVWNEISGRWEPDLVDYNKEFGFSSISDWYHWRCLSNLVM